MTIDEALKILEMQEEILQFTHFTNADAWELGGLIVSEARMRGLPIAVSIRLNNGFVVFQYGFDGTNYYNEQWMTRKFNTVKMIEKSSLHLYTLLQKSGETLEEWFLDPKDYALCGGGFPIRVEEAGVIGAIMVSGLEHVVDHDFLVKCISKYLHVDEVPRIKDGKLQR